MTKNILVVDDSQSIREVVTHTLENEGYNVMVGSDGKHALQFLDGTEIDMVITDLYMPEMDGIEFIKEVRRREEYKGVPILFLTTESQNEKKQMAKEAGATGWIVKPFVPKKLLAALNKVLR